MNSTFSYIIFTDGSSRGNPGPGGWGTVAVRVATEKGTQAASESHVTELGGGEKNTTNNRMEIMAAVKGLESVPENGAVTVYTDSSYLINSITKWINGWKKNNWQTKAKEDVLNKDLWLRLDAAIAGKTVVWKYVGGHVGITGNERCDVIATGLADGEDVKLYDGPLADYEAPDILNISHDADRAAKKKSSGSHSNTKAYSYISMVNKKIETHKTWAECEKRVKGASGARFKKALNPQGQEQIIQEFRQRSDL